MKYPCMPVDHLIVMIVILFYAKGNIECNFCVGPSQPIKSISPPPPPTRQRYTARLGQRYVTRLDKSRYAIRLGQHRRYATLLS